MNRLIIFLVNFLNATTGLQHSMTFGLISCIFATKYVIELKKLAQFILIQAILYGVVRTGSRRFGLRFLWFEHNKNYCDLETLKKIIS